MKNVEQYIYIYIYIWTKYMYSILGAIIWLLKLKNTFSSMRKKPHGKILKEEPKEQYLNIIPKSLSLSLSIYIYIY